MKRKGAADLRNQAEIKRVQAEADDAALIEEFERAIKDSEGEEADAVFNDVNGLYTWGELEYKKQNERSIMCQPSHVCVRGCHMRQVSVVVHRRVSHFGNQASEGLSAMQAAFGRWAFGRAYHLCFTDTCAHIRSNHACETPECCPHATRYQGRDTRRLDQFWVCTETGNVHICGRDCLQPKIVSPLEGEFVCSLTGVVTGQNLVAVQFIPNVHLLGAGEEDTDPMQAARASLATINMSRRKLAARAAMSDGVQDLAVYGAWVEAICEELFFSERRQLLEAEQYLLAYEKALEDMIKYLRVRKLVDEMGLAFHQFLRAVLTAQGPRPRPPLLYHSSTYINLVRVPNALAVFQFRAPVSPYFRNVPMLDSVARAMRRRLEQIDTKFIANGGKTSNAAASMVGTPEHARAVRERQEEYDLVLARADRDRFIRRVLYRRRLGAGGGCDTPAVADTALRRRNVKEVFATTLVRVWANLNKYEPQQQQVTFKKLVIALLYMTQKTLAIPDGSTAVTVIPKVDFAALLPQESQLHKFDLPACGSGGSNHTLFRKLTATQTEITGRLFDIARSGHLTHIQLRISDVYEEVARKRATAPEK